MRRFALVIIFLASGLLIAAPAAAASPSTTVVISQIYGAGGNTGAVYTHDFVELHNVGSADVDLGGMSLQYASASGTSWSVVPLTGTVRAGGYFLIQLASNGSIGAALPAPDFASSAINMGRNAGKVTLVDSTSAFAIPCPVGAATVVDFVGYGSTATCFEGAGPAPAPEPANAAGDVRGSSGCADTDDNSADFASAAPAPQNSGSPLHFCVADEAPYVAGTSPAGGADDVPPGSSVTIEFSEPVAVSESWYGISCARSGTHSASVAHDSSSTTFMLDPDADFTPGELCAVTVVASAVTDLDANDPPDTMAADETVDFTVGPGPPAQFLLTLSDYGPVAGSTVSVQAQLADEYGNAVRQAGRTVLWSTTGTDASFSAASSETNGSGVATVALTTSRRAGTIHVVTATDAADTSRTGTAAPLTTVPGAATHVALTSSTAALSSGSTRALTAEVRDANENVVTGDSSTEVTFAKGGGFGTVAGLGTTTASAGLATKTVTGVAAGEITIDASAAGLSADSATFTVVAGPADHLVVTSPTGDLASGQSRTLTAEVRDANENLVTGDSSTTVAFSKTAGSGTVSGLGGATASGGIAALTVTGRTAGPVTLEATAAGLGAAALTFTVVSGAADHLAFAPFPGTLASGSSRVLTVEVKDASGNTVTDDSGRSVSLAKTAGAGTVAFVDGAAALTSDGVASRTITGKVAGPLTVTVTSAGLTGTSASFTVIAGPPTHLSFVAVPATVPLGTARTLAVEVRDENENRVTTDDGRTVTLTRSSGSGAVSGLGTVQTSRGIASVTVTGSSSGGIIVAADAAALTGATAGFCVLAADGSGTLSTATLRAANRSTGNTLVFTYRAALGGIANGKVAIAVPPGWSAPSTAGNDPGYTAASAGQLTVSSRTIVVSQLSLRSGERVQVVYGSTAAGGPGVAAPSTGGAQTWTGMSKASGAGSLERLATSPSITVLAPDGSGAIAAAPTTVPARSSAVSVAFTYVPATGGIFDGALSLAVPDGWSAPTTVASDPGFVKASRGAISVSGRSVVVSGLILPPGQTLQIVYGARSGGGPGATARSSAGAQTWSVASRASAGGVLTTLAASPAITVTP